MASKSIAVGVFPGAQCRRVVHDVNDGLEKVRNGWFLGASGRGFIGCLALCARAVLQLGACTLYPLLWDFQTQELIGE